MSAPIAKSPFDRFSRSSCSHFLYSPSAAITRVVGRLELVEQGLVLDLGEGLGHGRLEEPLAAVHLFDRDLGGDPRRVLEVLARLGQRRGHGLFAGDEQPQPFVGRRVGPLDHQVGGVGDAAAVDVGIPRPGADDVERQDPRIDGPQQLLAIELVRRIQRRGVDRLDPLPEAARRRDGVGDRLPRVVVQLVVVLVDAEIRRLRRLAAIQILEILARERGERRVRGWLRGLGRRLRRAAGAGEETREKHGRSGRKRGHPGIVSDPRGFAPRTPRHAPSLAASPARSGRVARSRRSLATRNAPVICEMGCGGSLTRATASHVANRSRYSGTPARTRSGSFARLRGGVQPCDPVATDMADRSARHRCRSRHRPVGRPRAVRRRGRGRRCSGGGVGRPLVSSSGSFCRGAHGVCCHP